MRPLRLLEVYRRRDLERAHYGAEGDDSGGVFFVPGPRGRKQRMLHVIASNGDGWDHVSVSLPERCPTWEEMEHVKRLFFREDEAAMQLHVPPADHLNCHPYCLHLWRPQDVEIPRPPAIMVALPAEESA